MTTFVWAELGGRGDTVLVKKSVGRNKLLAQGLAVYPSPENKQMFAEELRVSFALVLSLICQILSNMKLLINLTYSCCVKEKLRKESKPEQHNW